MNTIAVSVIIPVYNAAPYIADTLQSLLKQTLTTIEIICVNDGSTDNSHDIIAMFQAKDGRIAIIDQKNSGASVARKNGLVQAQGEYVAFIDSDDWVSEDYLYTLYHSAKEHDADIAIVTSALVVMANGNTFATSMIAKPPKNSVLTQGEKTDVFMATGSMCNKIYRTSCMERWKNYFATSNSFAEDNSFTIRALLDASTVVLAPHGTYYYRWTENSLTKKTHDKAEIVTAFRVYSQLVEETINRYGRSSQTVTAILKRRNRDIYGAIVTLPTFFEKIATVIACRNAHFGIFCLAKALYDTYK